jgi:hypothetical protein
MNRNAILQCINADCARPFAFNGTMPGPFQEYEDITCPHCKTTCETRKTGGVFTTWALTAAEEDAWLGEQQKAAKPSRD